MVNLIIDGREITVKENTTIMEAASQNGIPIPKLCYLKGINEIAACRVTECPQSPVSGSAFSLL